MYIFANNNLHILYNMKYKTYFLYTLLGLLIHTPFIRSAAKEAYTTQRFVYMTTSKDTLTLEVDIPKGNGPFPYIIYVHGGGWSLGDLNVFKQQSIRLAAAGIAGVRISYPLIPKGGNFESAMHAIGEATQFIRKKASELQLDNSRYGFCGASAGAHLSAIAAMKTAGCNLYIGMAGNYDLLATKPGDFPDEKLRRTYLQSDDTLIIKQASAIYQIPARNIPACYFLHGTEDKAIEYKQCEHFAEVIRKKGGLAEVKLYEGVGHMINSRTDTTLLRSTVNDMILFCNKIFGRKRVACAGNSITYGVLLENVQDTYPFQLQKLLGDGYEVRNYGVPGAMVQLNRSGTYMRKPQFEDIKSYKPDIIILKLGTNDSRTNEWPQDAFFYADYARLVDELIKTGATVYLCYPIPPYGEKWEGRDKNVTERLIPIIDRIAQEKQLKVIDLYHLHKTEDSYYLPDGIHPNPEGYKRMAENIYKALLP